MSKSFISNNPKGRQQWILDLLENKPVMTYSECFAKYSPMFDKSNKTFDKDWNKAQEAHQERQSAINQAKLQTAIDEGVESIKRGIKTKEQHVAEMQTQIDDLTKIKAGEQKPAPDGALLTATYSDEIRAQAAINQLRKTIGEWQGFNIPPKPEPISAEGRVIHIINNYIKPDKAKFAKNADNPQ